MKKTLIFLLGVFFVVESFAQIRGRDVLPEVGLPTDENNKPIFSNPNPTVTPAATPRKDSLNFEHRDFSKETISIRYRNLNIPGWKVMDSSVNDFDLYFSVPSSYTFLGNNGSAVLPLIYHSPKTIGFDPGFHAFDLYRLLPEQTNFYQTSQPFTAIHYQLASGKEQMLRATHTQNPRTNFNFGFNYNMITAPGFFVTQNNNHNGYRLFSYYQGKHKRYKAYFSVCGNNIRASENGGISNYNDLLNPNFKQRFTVSTRMGSGSRFSNSPFVTNVNTGQVFRDFHFSWSHQYDFGERDSLHINDSVTEHLFYPRLRIQHTMNAHNYSRIFRDFYADSTFYSNVYIQTLRTAQDTFLLSEKWNVMEQDFSVWQFPDKKNQAQYFLAGMTYQQIKGNWRNEISTFQNVWIHGTYRNQTRNKQWNMVLDGQSYIRGLNEGDYAVNASLQRYLNRRWGNVQISFANVNRTPAFSFDARSVFNLGKPVDIKKENITTLGVKAENPLFTLEVKNILIANQTYYTNAYQVAQASKVINLTQITGSKKIQLGRHWNLYSDATLQQLDLTSPIRVPLFFLRNRLAYEGNFFKNLNLSTGMESRYYTSYKANGYSPVMGDFTVQDTAFVRNLPDIALFLHFRIRGFSGFIRAENLNTMYFGNGFGWVNNNFASPYYPTPGFLIRFGVRWWMIN